MNNTTLNERVLARIKACQGQRLHPDKKEHSDGMFDFIMTCRYQNVDIDFEYPKDLGFKVSYYDDAMAFVHFVGCSSFESYFVGRKNGEWYLIKYDRPAFSITRKKLPDNFTFDGMKWGWEPDPE